MEGGGLLRGRVEYCNSGIYKAICYDDSWDARDASVVCRQLGFAPHGKERPYVGRLFLLFFPSSTIPKLVDEQIFS